RAWEFSIYKFLDNLYLALNIKSVKLTMRLYMNKFWQFIIRVRDFCQQMSIKQYGIDGAGSEYKFKLFAFILGYVITVIFIILQAILYFYDGPILPSLNRTNPWYIKLLAGVVLFVLPT